MTFKLGVVEFEKGHDSSGANLGTQRVYQLERFCTSLEDYTAASRQLRGQVGRTVAVTWADDPEIDGLYKVTSCNVSPAANYMVNNLLYATVTLTAQPDLVEAGYTLTHRATAPTDYYVSAVHGYYDEPDDSYAWGNGLYYLQDHTAVAGPDSEPAFLHTGNVTATTADVMQVQQGVDPHLFDVGVCKIEVSRADSTFWWTLTETDSIPNDHDVRVSNGMVRATIIAGEPYLLAEVWSGSVWSEAARVSFGASSILGGFVRRFGVLRNDHAKVTVRCPIVRVHQRPVLVDVTLTRGVPVAETRASIAFEDTPRTLIAEIAEFDGTNMATSVLSGDNLVRTAANGDGVTVRLFGDPAGTPNATTDQITYATALTALFGVGGGTGSTDMARTNYGLVDRGLR